MALREYISQQVVNLLFDSEDAAESGAESFLTDDELAYQDRLDPAKELVSYICSVYVKKEVIHMDSFLLTVFVFGSGLFSTHTIVWPVLHVSVWGLGGSVRNTGGAQGGRARAAGHCGD